MQTTTKLAIVTILTLAVTLGYVAYRNVLTAPGVDPAFVSATLSVGKDGQSALNAETIKHLSDWLSRHSSGWQPLMVTPAHAGSWLELVYPDGRHSTLLIQVERKPPGGGLIINFGPRGGAIRSFSEKEFAALLSIIAGGFP